MPSTHFPLNLISSNFLPFFLLILFLRFLRFLIRSRSLCLWGSFFSAAGLFQNFWRASVTQIMTSAVPSISERGNFPLMILHWYIWKMHRPSFMQLKILTFPIINTHFDFDYNFDDDDQVYNYRRQPNFLFLTIIN